MTASWVPEGAGLADRAGVGSMPGVVEDASATTVMERWGVRSGGLRGLVEATRAGRSGLRKGGLTVG